MTAFLLAGHAVQGALEQRLAAEHTAGDHLAPEPVGGVSSHLVLHPGQQFPPSALSFAEKTEISERDHFVCGRLRIKSWVARGARQGLRLRALGLRTHRVARMIGDRGAKHTDPEVRFHCESRFRTLLAENSR